MDAVEYKKVKDLLAELYAYCLQYHVSVDGKGTPICYFCSKTAEYDLVEKKWHKINHEKDCEVVSVSNKIVETLKSIKNS